MKAKWLDIDSETYHSDYTALSRGMLWRFAERRKAYKAEFIDCSRPPRKPSDVMLMGTLAHAGMLHPDSLESLYAVFPDEVLGKGGRKGTTASGEWQAEQEAAGRICLKADQMAIVRAMVASVQGKLANWLKISSIREKPIYWQNSETGLLCRCMPDWLIITKTMAYGFDLKTTTSAHPDDFVRKCQDYGYWLQSEHYSEGITAVTGLPCQFRFVVVESEFPHTCAIEEISPIHHPDASEARLKLLRELKACMESGDFSEPWEREIQPLVLRPGSFDVAA